jgi:hypothetical protein
MKRYKIIACHVLWRELCYFASLSRHVFDIEFLPQGLHNTPDTLRQELQDAVDRVEGDYEAILVGYGLCCNGVDGIVARKFPLVLMRGHDCITFLLGSKEQYQSFFDAHPGTYWYSPGWIDTGTQPGKERYEGLLQSYTEKFGEDNAAYLMDMEQGWFKEYSHVAYTDLGFGDTSHFREFSRDCAQWLGWDYHELQGDPQLMQDFLEGKWDSEAFLEVEPGQKILASHDERIIEAKDAGLPPDTDQA